MAEIIVPVKSNRVTEYEFGISTQEDVNTVTTWQRGNNRFLNLADGRLYVFARKIGENPLSFLTTMVDVNCVGCRVATNGYKVITVNQCRVATNGFRNVTNAVQLNTGTLVVGIDDIGGGGGGGGGAGFLPPETIVGKTAAPTNRKAAANDPAASKNPADQLHYYDPASIGGWAYNSNNYSLREGVDIYIDGYKIMSADAERANYDTNSSLGVPPTVILGWQANISNVQWWQDGSVRELRVYVKGTSTPVQIYVHSLGSTVPFIRISKSNGGSGIPHAPLDHKSLSTHTTGVSADFNIDPRTIGFTHSPQAWNMTYLKSSQMTVGLSNLYGCICDFIARPGQTRSITRQFDAGLQLGLDLYIGGASREKMDQLQSLGWVTATQYDTDPTLAIGWNSIPQGTYGSIIPPPNGFGGLPEDENWDVNGNKVHYSKASYYQYPWAKAGQKIYGHFKQEQYVRFVAANVVHFRVSVKAMESLPGEKDINDDWTEMKGLIDTHGYMDDVKMSPFIFYDNGVYPYAMTYQGGRPFEGESNLQSTDMRQFTVPRLDGVSFQASECWSGGFTQDGSDGIALLWPVTQGIQTRTAYEGSDVAEPTSSGGGSIYNNTPIQRWVRGETKVFDYYVMVGSVAEVRAMAKRINMTG